MNKQTQSILKKCGVPSHLLGYDYLGEAMEIIHADRSMIHAIVGKVYPAVAEKFGSTPSRVERAIRHAIEIAFNNLTPDEVKEIFGNTLRYSYKATNSHFIAALVELME